MQYQLRFSGKHYEQIKQHLFPGDGKEAVAVVLCGRHEGEDISILLTHKVELIPYNECERNSEYVKWKTERIIPFLEEAEKVNMGILKIHSHPGGYPRFSKIDDKSDSELFPSIYSWSETKSVHGSAVMLPNGKIFGRVFTSEMKVVPFDKISVSGDAIQIWRLDEEIITDKFSLRTIQVFGEGTYTKLRKLKAGVVGCSGTGSPTIEQLVRLGVGELVIVDPDPVEDKNLNRILNSTKKDADDARNKTTVLEDAIHRIGIGTVVIPFDENLYDCRKTLLELITCDIIFGCVDSVDGRHLISQLTNFYLIPYLDMGVRLIANKKGSIETIVGSVNYIQPGCSTLLSRKLYDIERLRVEAIKRSNPEEYKELVKRKYIEGIDVERPAVISINMQISSMAINEFLNRIHRFKDDTSDCYARVMMDYCGGCIENAREDEFDQDDYAVKWAGRGDYKPFLRMPDLE